MSPERIYTTLEKSNLNVKKTVFLFRQYSPLDEKDCVLELSCKCVVACECKNCIRERSAEFFLLAAW